MRRSIYGAVILALVTLTAAAWAQTADVVLVNGKIVYNALNR